MWRKKILTAVWAVATATAAWGQSGPDQLQPRAGESVETFNSPALLFRFQYSDLLLRCELQKHGTGYDLVPLESCSESQFPLCEDGASQSSTMIVCFAYPKARFRDAPTFNGAAFSVAKVEGAPTKNACLAGSPDWVVAPLTKPGTSTINGVVFRLFRISDAAMSHALSAEVYRTFHDHACYQLSIRWSMTNPGAYDPGTIREFTKEDWDEVTRHLEQARDSFQFLR